MALVDIYELEQFALCQKEYSRGPQNDPRSYAQLPPLYLSVSTGQCKLQSQWCL